MVAVWLPQCQLYILPGSSSALRAEAFSGSPKTCPDVTSLGVTTWETITMVSGKWFEVWWKFGSHTLSLELKIKPHHEHIARQKKRRVPKLKSKAILRKRGNECQGHVIMRFSTNTHPVILKEYFPHLNVSTKKMWTTWESLHMVLMYLLVGMFF